MARLSSAFVATAIVLGLASSSRADYDAAADFSPTSNPNGVWSYGQAPTLGGAFSLFTTHHNVGGIDYWGVGADLTPPEVFHNGTSGVITFSTITIQPGQLAFHPGPQDQFAIVRFTSPVAGIFSLNSSFIGIDTGGTTTDVHVLLNGASLFSGLINGYGNTKGYASTVALGVGDTLDFEVGYGSNGNYFNDSTGISARLRSVPEPSSIVLVGAGFSGVVYAARRRNRGPRRS